MLRAVGLAGKDRGEAVGCRLYFSSFEGFIRVYLGLFGGFREGGLSACCRLGPCVGISQHFPPFLHFFRAGLFISSALVSVCNF